MLSTVDNACPSNTYTTIEGKLGECYKNAFTKLNIM